MEFYLNKTHMKRIRCITFDLQSRIRLVVIYLYYWLFLFYSIYVLIYVFSNRRYYRWNREICTLLQPMCTKTWFKYNYVGAARYPVVTVLDCYLAVMCIITYFIMYEQSNIDNIYSVSHVGVSFRDYRINTERVYNEFNRQTCNNNNCLRLSIVNCFLINFSRNN